MLADDQQITFSGAGQILHGDAETIERELVYLVENEEGYLEVLKPSEFQKRIGQPSGIQPAGEAGAAKVTRSTAPQPKPAQPTSVTDADANRRVAQWVLSVGGSLGVEVAGQRIDVKAADGLPAQAFPVTDVDLANCSTVEDNSVAALASLPDLQRIDLRGTPVTTVGLTRFLPLKNLQELCLAETKADDVMLACLARFPTLRKLNLQSTSISNDGLLRLKSLRQLESLDLLNTAVTPEGVAALHEALPNCRIVWSGGTVESRGVIERRIAEWVLSRGGNVSFWDEKGGSGGTESLEKLPQRPSRLTLIILSGEDWGGDEDLAKFNSLATLDALWISASPQITDLGVEHVARLRGLTNLQLTGTSVSDAGAAKLLSLTDLQTLTLRDTLLTSSALESIGKMKKLESLDLSGTGVSNEGLERLGQLGCLKELRLQGTAVTDDGMQHVARLPLAQINVANTRVGDRGVATLSKMPTIEHLGIGGPDLSNDGITCLANCPKLVSLSLGSAPRFTDDGLKHVAGLKQLARLQLVGVPITDAGLAQLQGLTQLESLYVQAEITDAGLTHLRNLKALRLAAFYGCNQVTPAGMAKLHEALPQCHITRGDFVLEPKAE